MDKENPLRSIFYIVSILAFAVCWVWRNNFAEWEYTFTEKTQKWGLEYPSQIISYEGMTGALLGYALLVYNLEAYRPRVYFEILWAVVGLGLVPLMKMIVAAPRPYMVKPSISTWKSDCECDYGMPSGHAFSATLLSVLIYKRVIEFIHPSKKYVWIPQNTELANQENQLQLTATKNSLDILDKEEILADISHRGKKEPLVIADDAVTPSSKSRYSDYSCFLIKMAALIVLSLFTISVALSRVVLGVHSISQVVFGIVFGLVFADFVFVQFYNRWLRRYSKMFFMNYSNKYQRKYVITKRILYLPILNLTTAIFYLARLSYPPDQMSTWIGNIEVSNCSEANRPAKRFEWKCYKDTIFMNLYILFNITMTLLRRSPYQYDRDYWRHSRWAVIAYRNINLLGSLGIGALFEILGKRMENNYYEHNTEGFILWPVLFRFLFLLIFCILHVYLFPRVGKELGLSTAGDTI